MDEILVRTAIVKTDPLIRKRLKDELKRLGVTVEVVADLSGIAKGTLDNILIGRVESMKDIHLQSIWIAYPEINMQYILTGVEPLQSNLTDDVPTVYLPAGGGLLNFKIESK